MEPFLADQFANPSGMHAAARRRSRRSRSPARWWPRSAAARRSEIVFTGGGSEGDNLAVKGAAWAARDAGGADGIVTTAIEHKAVLGACDRLEREGFRSRRIGVDAGGAVDLDALADALDDRTAVVSVMLVNNETGIVQPLADVAELVRARRHRAVVHTDAVQAVPWLDLASARGRRRPGDDLRAQVRRPEGRRRARRARRCAARAPDRRRRPRGRAPRRHAERRGDRRAGRGAARHRTTTRGGVRAHRRRCATGSRPASRVRVPGFVVNGDAARRVPGILNCAFAGRRGRDPPGRARSAGGVRRVGLGLHLGRHESVARPPGDGMRPGPRARVDPVQPRTRTTPPTSTRPGRDPRRRAPARAHEHRAA